MVLISLPIGCGLVVLYALWLAFSEPRPSAKAGEGEA